VITSATSSASGGTTILKMADLTKVRMRAFVNETDIGNVKPAQTATVTVDAFPNRRFVGLVEQVEPQAVVQSSVTMFPVLISLNNSDAALKPGMNGQVVMDITRHDNVLAVPSDAIRNSRDASTVATVLGLTPDSVRAAVAAARGARGGFARGAGGAASSTVATAGGDTTRRRRFAGGTAADSAAFRARFRGGAASGTASSFGGRGQFAGGQGGGAGTGGTAGGGGGGGGGGAGGGGMLVFVKKNDKYSPRVVRVGISDFDYTEILSGVEQGELVALLGPAVLQAQREAQQARVRAGAGGGLQQQTTPAAGGAGGAGGGGGGAGGNRGGRGGG
jgi:HlyD family secretion protein